MTMEVDSWPESKYRIAGGFDQNTWERHVPQATDHWIHLFHIARYRYAFDHLRSTDRVLDVGCGVGYGSAILSRRAESVAGIDISAEAIEFARSHYADSNTEFRVRDWSEALQDSNYSFVVAFEFLEHIVEQERFIELVAKGLVNGGQLFVSTPNAGVSKGKNLYHLHELSLEEFRGLLGKHFKDVHIVGQYIKSEFYIRQKKLFNYFESWDLPLPSVLQRRLRKKSRLLRRELESILIGLQLEDIVFSKGETKKSFIFVARCCP